MARKPIVEVEGALYHIITRGNNRQLIFGSHDDYLKILLLLDQQKTKLPFYLYAYCLMPNHIHLLVERQQDSISRVKSLLLLLDRTRDQESGGRNPKSLANL